MTRPPTCQLSVIGAFELRDGVRPVTTRGSAARLLAMLALTGRTRATNRTTIAARLWRDEDATRSSGRLRSMLWRLPRVGGAPLVVCTPSALALAAHVDVDLWQAERRAQLLASKETDIENDDLVRSTASLAEFAHDILPDWPDDWLITEREAFRQTRLHALERASQRLRQRRSLEAALQAALTAVACEPLRESAHREVIHAHLAEGNAAEALRQYHVYRRLLAAQLGLAPSPTMLDLVADLLGHPADRQRPELTR